jgi:GMP synthase (glutamine-hydrolysing)
VEDIEQRSREVSREKTRGVIAVLEHGTNEATGELGRHAVNQGYQLKHCRVDEERTELPTPGSYDMLLVMGSFESVNNSSLPWIERERQYVSEIVASDMPMLGVCFGAQLLAQCLGGSVKRLDRAEIGWKFLDTVDSEFIVPGPWLVWHEDEVSVPKEVTVLATSDLCVQAFESGPHVGVQFHPEITSDILNGWLSIRRKLDFPDELAFERFVREGVTNAETSKSNAAHFFDRFVARFT